MKFLGIFALVFGLFQCASAKFEQDPPFKVKGATFNHYVGGMPGVSGTWVRINYETNTEIKFDSIYFQGRKTVAQLQTNKSKTYVSGHFNTSTVRSKKDLILHRDGKKEYGNKPPTAKIPFELKENEAIISYSENGKTKYFKVENIKQTATDVYP